MNISACLVTRGDVDMTPILESLPFDDIVVWDNSERPDLGVWGRYAATAEAEHDLIYTQDDDCIVPVHDLLAQYEEGERLCNMPTFKQDEYPSSSLLGWGAIFSRDDAIAAAAAWSRSHLLDDLFFRTCDCVFSTLMPFRRVDVGHQDLPYATAPDRMYYQSGHYEERARVTRLALELAGQPA